MARFRPNPPPARAGVSASCTVLPAVQQQDWPRVEDYLVHRFPHIAAATWRQRFSRGGVITDEGQPVTPTTPYAAGMRVYYYRELSEELPIPFDEVVIHHDAHLLVVDKPHFLPVMPSGKYLQETVLVRLKNRLGLNELAPIHRIDRDTAGLVMFSVNPATRDAYHALFRERKVGKVYQAIAAWNPALNWPLQRASRIGASDHFMQQQEVDGVPNAYTEIQPLEIAGGLAKYELRPSTGQRHQLRVHMAALGLPILNDGIYPKLTPEGQMDPTRPLQLLAQSLEFSDPLTGEHRQFESRRKLLAF